MLDLNMNDVAQPHTDKAMKDDDELSGSSSTSSVVESPNISTGELFVTRQLFPLTSDDFSGGEAQMASLGLLGGSSQLAGNCSNQEWLKLAVSGSGPGQENPPGNKQQVRRSRRGPRSRSSQYRGVTFYRRTGRWESHIWDCGKQVYLGGFDTAHAAARAYDRAAIKFRGVDADINFNIADYDEDMKQMKNLTKEEFVHILRRQSTGFARGSSRYRGVTLHKCGRWEARMGQFLGKKAYDKAAIECNGREAVTNFEPSTYEGGHDLSMQLNNNGGSDHNLDLNLGISITIDGPKGSNNLKGAADSLAHHSPLPLANGKRPLSGNCGYYPAPPGVTVTPLHGQPLASRQTTPIMWSAFSPPAAFQESGNNEEKDQAMSSERFSNWGWYAQSQGGGGGGGGNSILKQAQVHQVLSNTSVSAASSGFYSSSTANYHPLTNNPPPEKLTTPHLHPPPRSSSTSNSSFHPYSRHR